MRPEGGVRRNPNVVWRRETRGGDSKGILLFSYETRNVHFLDGLGKRVWEELNGADFKELVEKLDAKGRKNQVLGFLKELEERRLITINGRKSPPSTDKAQDKIQESTSGMWSRRVYFDAPLFVQFDCTNHCNLRCRHCVTRGGEELRDELSTQDALKLIRELGSIGVFQIGFSGGEPLTRKDIFTIMEEVKR